MGKKSTALYDAWHHSLFDFFTWKRWQLPSNKNNGVFGALLVSYTAIHVLMLMGAFSVLTILLSLHIFSLCFCTTFLEAGEIDLSMCNSDGIGGDPWH